MQKSVGEALVYLLENYGVDTVFGIPGVHTVELYRGLAASSIRHITPRHELSAGFMADGYARISGKPGVCFLITGPGLTNAITAMAQARADSIPMLVISGVNKLSNAGVEEGHLHELPNQAAMMATIALSTQTLQQGCDLEDVLERAFSTMRCSRPGPVHIEVPLDVMTEVIDVSKPIIHSVQLPTVPSKAVLKEAATRCNTAQHPVILVGGGALAVDVQPLAEQLDAPVVSTVNARGMLAGHPLNVPASPSLKSVRDLLEHADLVLAIGTEFGPTDFDMYLDGNFPPLRQLIRIDVDESQSKKGPKADQVIVSDASIVTESLLPLLRTRTKDSLGASRAAKTKRDAYGTLPAIYQDYIQLLNSVSTTLPNVVMVGDSTQLVYAGNLFCEINRKRGWFNSATGYGSLGYGVPAAIGAQLATKNTPVVCLTGDGGFQFCLAELGTAMDEQTPVIFIVWNNQGYQEIETYMVDKNITPVGVKPTAPDFVMIAAAYGMRAEKITETSELPHVLTRANAAKCPYLIEIQTN